MKYSFVGIARITVLCEVEAGSLKEAMEQAHEFSPVSLCHQCSDGDKTSEWCTSGELDFDASGIELTELRINGVDATKKTVGTSQEVVVINRTQRSSLEVVQTLSVLQAIKCIKKRCAGWGIHFTEHDRWHSMFIGRKFILKVGLTTSGYVAYKMAHFEPGKTGHYCLISNASSLTLTPVVDLGPDKRITHIFIMILLEAFQTPISPDIVWKFVSERPLRDVLLRMPAGIRPLRRIILGIYRAALIDSVHAM